MIQFQNYKIQALINFSSKINAITLAYVAELGFTTQKTSIGVQKIDNLLLEIYDIVLARFLIQDNLKKIYFFKETFLLANRNIKVILEILFLAFSNTDFQFDVKKLT